VTEVLPPVDLETVLVGELEDDPELGALTGGPGDGARISTRLHRDFDREATLRLERAGGGAIGWPDHIDRAVVNFHAYGPGDAEAYAVAARTVVALARVEGTTVAGGVITAVERILGPTWTPDPDADNAPRYLLQYAVTAHPTS
jgi:hypothetical protein